MNEETPKLSLPPRLRRPGEFRRARRAGKRYRLAFLELIVHRASGQPRSGSQDSRALGRVGFVVPERVIKKATKRNRVRRLLREAVRLWWGSIQPGHDLLLCVRSLPRHDHAWYVEGVFLQLLLSSGILRGAARRKARGRLGELPSEFREPQAEAQH